MPKKFYFGGVLSSINTFAVSVKAIKARNPTSPIRQTARIMSSRVTMSRNKVKSMVDGNVHNENDEGVSPETDDPHFAI
jgi:hypothetical protein